MKKYKVISHAERMQNRDFEKIEVPSLVVESEINVLEDEVIEGRIVKVMKTKKLDPRDNFRGYKVSDFYLENLQACGAIGNLKPCNLSGSSVDMIDGAVVAFQELENINISEN